MLAFIIFLVWDVDSGIFERVHRLFFLGYEPTTGAPMGSMWEWYFRSYLDHWSTLLGMIFAVNFPIVSLFYRKLEARSRLRQWLGKSAVAAGILCALAMWTRGPMMMDKIQYNSTNPYFGFIPLITYIYLRNLTPQMRSYSSELLHEIGKTTLETYLMQHHIWLSSNSKTVLVFLPGWPRVNTMLVTVCYVVLSRKLYKLTLSLRGMLLPEDRTMCIRSVAGIVLTIIWFMLTAFIMSGMDMITLPAIGIVSVVCGALLYQTITDNTWAKYCKSVNRSREGPHYDDDHRSKTDKPKASNFSTNDIEDDTATAKLFSPLIGAMLLFVLGLIWNELAVSGASGVGLLPSGCDTVVNNGMWIKTDGCNTSSKGMAYRDYGMTSYGTCAPHGGAYTWVWKVQPSNSHCRFGYRGESKIKNALSHRSVVFVGDSMSRNLYYSSLRAIGVDGAGAYDATMPKHTDIIQTVWDGTTPVNFKWAPLAIDQLNVLRGLNRIASNGGTQMDLVVLGGGAWDRLHVYASDEDRRWHASTLKELSREMKRTQKESGASVVWFIPTTINDPALNTEEKRDHMREEDMESMRSVYSHNGVLSASSFVIDGTAFTKSRVSESYDGVHYPHDVYDAGSQILFNALDWLLPDWGIVGHATPPKIGKMANPIYGMIMLGMVIIGLVFFDGFLGFSYLASVFVKGIKPIDLYDEAYSALHRRLGMNGADTLSSPKRSSKKHKVACVVPTPKSKTSTGKSRRSIDEEIAVLLGKRNVGEVDFT